VPPELAAQLAPLAAACGLTSTNGTALTEAVAALDKPRQRGVIEHWAAVATHLKSLGL